MKIGNDVFNKQIDWELSESGIWKGKSNKFYRIGKDNSLFTSLDLTDWEYSQDNIWKDINSRYIKIIEDNLFSSSDKENWILLKDRSWQSPAGVLYKLDGDFNLYTKGTQKLYGLINLQN